MTKLVYRGKCSHCGHSTESQKPGIVACKWGRCNGLVRILQPEIWESVMEIYKSIPIRNRHYNRDAWAFLILFIFHWMSCSLLLLFFIN